MPELAERAVERELTFAQAVREALAEEMRRDPTVCIIGEDVAEAGTPFKVLSGLVEEFGKERVIDTPISEAGFTGVGVGAAMTGMRPVVDIMFGDFLTLTMDQMVNQAAKVHYMSGGKWKVPMVLRTTLGATRRSAAQHSQSLHAWFSHVPGLKVVLPSTPYDAKGLLKTAIRDDNPVVFFEDKMMYKTKGPVPEGDYTIPFGVADIKREGTDVTIVGTSSMVQVALGAAALLEEIGISAEVIDPRTTWPLDEATLIERGVVPWTELPLWLPSSDPEFGGFMEFSCARAAASELRIRPLVETIDATAALLGSSERSGGWRGVLSADKERELLAAARSV